MLGAGICKKPREKDFYQQDGALISAGEEKILYPDEERGRKGVPVDFIGGAIIVKKSASPQYVYVPDFEGNHVWKVQPGPDKTFEYMLANGWSEGQVLKSFDEFKQHVLSAANRFNQPAKVGFSQLQTK